MESGDPQTYALIGAAMEAHKRLGCGFHELIYHEAYEIELQLLGIPYVHEAQLQIPYRDRILKQTFRVDFTGFVSVLIELKALPKLTSNETSQVLNYLKASNFPVALLINFGAPELEFKRFVGPNYRG